MVNIPQKCLVEHFHDPIISNMCLPNSSDFIHFHNNSEMLSGERATSDPTIKRASLNSKSTRIIPSGHAFTSAAVFNLSSMLKANLLNTIFCFSEINACTTPSKTFRINISIGCAFRNFPLSIGLFHDIYLWIGWKKYANNSNCI